ncbi:sensor histidine kinase [Desulfococcus sp.]|uniref:sensor histidine kinase n=1 Tax=Desulfococcus sp. TaxID=2025834 RepID=UPI003593D5B8
MPRQKKKRTAPDKKVETFLYCMAQIIRNSEVSFAERAQAIANLLPKSCGDPSAAACIRLDQQVFYSPGYSEENAAQILFERICIQGRHRGLIKIAGQPESGQGHDRPAVGEERRLIRTVAHQLSLMLEKEEAEIRKTELEAQVRHADRLAKIGQVAAGFAHEINNPLNSILGFAQLAAGAEGLPEQAARDIERIIQAALHAREVVRKLMLYSRQVPPQEREVDLNLLVRENVHFMKHLCEKHHVEIVQDMDETLGIFPADPFQLRQVLMNLIMNAVQAMPDGGTLTIRTRREEGRITLAVEDTGTGMDPATLDHIFIPFFTTKEIDQGTGLGLSVVQGIVEAHSADIRVSSRKGSGSTFLITFPPQEKRGLT